MGNYFHLKVFLIENFVSYALCMCVRVFVDEIHSRFYL